jgi:hypothetical protein
MPPDRRLRLENLQSIQHAGRHTIKPNKHKTVEIAEHQSLRRLALQHIELMTKDENFRVQASSGPQSTQKTPNQPEEIAHRTEYHPIRSWPSAMLGLR